MKGRPLDKSAARRPTKPSGLDGRHHDANGEIRQRRGNVILGLGAFEKISAVEGIRLSQDMRNDLRSLDASDMDAGQRSRFITRKYGNK